MPVCLAMISAGGAPDWVAYWPYAVAVALGLAGAACDLRTGKIPNVLTYSAAAGALVAHTLLGGPFGPGVAGGLGLSGSLAGLAAGFVPMLVAVLMGGIGGGDAKIIGAAGALGGWRFALATMFYSFIAAAVMALVILLFKRRLRKTMARVGRFLLLLPAPGARFDPAVEDSPKLPFGLAVLAGAVAASAQMILTAPGDAIWGLGI